MEKMESANCGNVMVLRHIWHRQAWVEFEDTVTYIHDAFGKGTAERVFNDVVARVRQLCLFPKSGLRYKDLYHRGNEVRILHMRKASNIYCYDEGTLYILSYWVNRRNPDGLIELLAAR